MDKFFRETEARALGFSGKSVQVKTTQFDAKGRVTCETKPRFDSDRIHSIIHVFDDLDRISTVTQTLGTVDADNPDAVVVVKTSYEGARIDTSNQVNGLVSHQRWEVKNALGKVASVTDTLGVLASPGQSADTAAMHTMSYEYDPEGNLTGSTDPVGNHVTIHYDGRGRKERLTDPDLGEWKYTYDGFGDLITQKDPKHGDQLTTMTYDRLGRVLTRSDVDGTSQWIYDTAPGKGVGKLAGTAGPMDDRFADECSPPGSFGDGVASGKRAIRWSEYSDLGDPIESFECTDGATFNVSTDFIQARPSVMRYPAVQESRMAVSYHYNAAGYLQYLMDDGPNKLLWAALEANAQGQITREVTPNGVETVNERNPSTGWLMHTESHAQLEFDDLIQNWTYGYDEVGNIRHRDQADLAHRIATTEGFTYDELDRLKTADTTFAGGGTVGAESFDYNAIGNVTRKGDLSFSYVGCGAGPHAVCAIGDRSTLSYDANGNFSSGGGRTARFNGRDKAVHMVGNNALVDLIYGAEGNRAVQLAGTSEGDPMAERTVYVGMGSTGKSLYERTTKPGSTEHVHFLYAGSAHGGAAFAVRTITKGGSGTVSTATRYAHFDHLGSVTALSDEAGHVGGGTPSAAGTSGLWSYDSWGAMRSSDGAGTSQSNIALPAGHRGFTGHETMPHIGLVNMNGRIYDPLIGRFLSPDPTVQFIANLQSYNRYSYVLNNPLRYTDPTGYSLNKWNYLVDVLAVAGAVVACVVSDGTACSIAIGVATSIINTQSAIANGTPWDQAVSLGIIEFSLFMMMADVSGGSAEGAVGLGGMARGAGSAAASAAFSTAVADLSATGELGWNVLENAGMAAAMAAFTYALANGIAKVTQASSAQGGETVDSVLAAAGYGQTSSDDLGMHLMLTETFGPSTPSAVVADRAGDVWLYTSDGSKISNAIARQQLLHGSPTPLGETYSHSSINISESQLFSSDRRGSHIESQAAVLNRAIGAGRRIDVYSPTDALDIDRVRAYAQYSTNMRSNVYIQNGVCSTEVNAAAAFAGRPLANGFVTPNNLASSPYLRYVGSYDSVQGMSIPAR
jgi:RHS repeat-associated protein